MAFVDYDYPCGEHGNETQWVITKDSIDDQAAAMFAVQPELNIVRRKRKMKGSLPHLLCTDMNGESRTIMVGDHVWCYQDGTIVVGSGDMYKGEQGVRWSYTGELRELFEVFSTKQTRYCGLLTEAIARLAVVPKPPRRVSPVMALPVAEASCILDSVTGPLR